MEFPERALMWRKTIADVPQILSAFSSPQAPQTCVFGRRNIVCTWGSGARPFRSSLKRRPRGDGDRGQTKGLTRAAGQRGGAQAEAGSDEEFKGGKRLPDRGRKGRTAKGKRPKGDGLSSRAEGNTGIGVAGGGDGANSGQKKQNEKKNGYDL